MNPCWNHDEPSLYKRKDREKIFQQLDFDITHKCNKNCGWCNLQIQTSPFDYLAVEQVQYVAGCVNLPESSGLNSSAGSHWFILISWG